MVAYSSKPDTTHYKCLVEGCGETGKRARPQIKVPASPTKCPQRPCKLNDVALVVDPRLSNMVQLHMVSASFGFNVKQPRPEFGAAAIEQQQRQRQRADAGEELAAR